MTKKILDKGEPSNDLSEGDFDLAARLRAMHAARASRGDEAAVGASWSEKPQMRLMLHSEQGRAEIHHQLAMTASGFQDLDVAITYLMVMAECIKDRAGTNLVDRNRSGAVSDIAAHLSRALREATEGNDRDLQRLHDCMQTKPDIYRAINGVVARAIDTFGQSTLPRLSIGARDDCTTDDIPTSELWSARWLKGDLVHLDFKFNELTTRFVWERLCHAASADPAGKRSHGAAYVAAELMVEAKALDALMEPKDKGDKGATIRRIKGSIQTAVSRHKSPGTE